MLTDGGISVRLRDERHKYATALDEWFGYNFDRYLDDESGDVECLTGHFARCGRRIFFTDDRGFCWHETFKNAESAKAMFDALDGYYCAWGDDDLEGEARRRELEQRDSYLTYTFVTLRDGGKPRSFVAWSLYG